MSSEDQIDFIGEKDWFFMYWVAYYKYKYKQPISSPELLRNLESKLKYSQQTISRRSKELESMGYLRRMHQNQKVLLELTPKGVHKLRKVHRGLDMIFSEFESCLDEFSGNLNSGMGEGRYYIQTKNYLTQFSENLGYQPYFGTLNVSVDKLHYDMIQDNLNNYPAIIIQGFHDGEREYGQVHLYRAEIWVNGDREQRVEGAYLDIKRTSHQPNVLEFIAEECLREHFDIDDGDVIHFQFITC